MNRWVRLGAAVIAMVMIGNLQYAWTLFVEPMRAATGWKLSEVQLGFTLFIALGTWAMPLSGFLIDHMGPRTFMVISGVLCAGGWGWMGRTHSLTEFYVLYSIAGFGGAFVYCCGVAMALKWFPDRRGLASGLVTAGFGMGAAAFNPVFASLIKGIGYRDTLLYTGIVQGIVIVAAGLLLANPPKGWVAPGPVMKAKAKVRRHSEEFNSLEMLKTPQFYMLYAMMLAIGIGGLMVTANVSVVARSYKITAAALTIALVLNPLFNGTARIFWGWVSDHMGRENTMFLAFGLQSIFMLGATKLGPLGDVWFVALMALVFFTWGELYVLFPAVLADLYGPSNAAANYSILYSTKGVAAIPAGFLAGMLFEKSGTWDYAFYGSAALALFSALGALWLKRMPLPKKSASPIAVPTPGLDPAAAGK